MASAGFSQNGDYIEDMPAEELLSVDFSDGYDVFGEQELFPRVGEQFQVEIPSLITESDYLLYTKNPIDAENRACVPFNFLIGLSVPLMWVNKEVENMKHEMLQSLGGSTDAASKNGHLLSEIVREPQFRLKDEDVQFKVEPLDLTLDSGIAKGELANLTLEDKMHQYRGLACCLVPGSVGDFWSDSERASFLLGLYIFEKNFVQVKRFIESKEMGDVLSFYYGKFYRSNEYRRWSECLKMKSRKCAYGQRIFTGLRQQELLSRLFPHVSEECQNAVSEVTKTFGEGKMSLHEYVFSLKAMVGMKVLVEAVGIGKGKQDLTGIALEPLKSNQTIPLRPEIPTGKACSALSPSEIIKFLTGDYRLSKARSNDLFWEAVWPRLLARGWHSEQPKDQGYAAASKHSLVFLMPGVKKFSRRRLVKGKDYFDSTTDVLSKVASEPGILELDFEDEGRNSGEYEWINETKLQQDDLPERRRHSYLQPRTPSRSTDAMKFTVVDTSLAGKPFKVRELRTLPFEFSNKLTSGSHFEDSEEDASDVSTDVSDTADAMLLDQEETKNDIPTKTLSERLMYLDRKDLEGSALKLKIASNGSDSMNAPLNNSKNHNKLCAEKQPKKAIKCQLSRRLKQDNLDFSAPMAKRRRRLNTCRQAETSHDTVPVTSILDKEMCSCRTDNPNSTEDIFPQVCLSQDKLSSTSSSKASPVQSTEGSPTGNCHDAEHPNEKHQPRTLIDLNIPQVPPDFESGVFIAGSTEGQDQNTSREPDDPCALKTALNAASSQQQLNMNSRRQSTRNRLPTTKALEALANGFLTINERRRSKGGGPQASRSSRRARVGMRFPESCIDTVASMVEEGGDGVCNADTSNMFSQYQILPEGKEGSQVPGP
ncbi:unnamed protein product [Ilex paraguariensis]|uniref:SANT domain-containing protein n=1 Tax=Ilex paraguariensis TaxID=185542 RepID=A0ABC8SNN4_9AQUA